MSSPIVKLTLDAPTGHYQPGDRLTRPVHGRWIEAVGRAGGRAFGAVVHGRQGEEDMAVHYFERLVDEPGRPLDLPCRIGSPRVLPASPLSYDGQIVKVCWCVRLRLSLPHGQESLTEVPFRLGECAASAAAGQEPIR